MSHVASKGMYFTIFGALMVLTVATYAVTFVDMGYFNLPIALAVAVTKALLVITFFMHVGHAPKLVKVTAGIGFFFLIIMVMFTMSDYLSRGHMGLPTYPTSTLAGTTSTGLWKPAKVLEPETAAEKKEAAAAAEHEKAAPKH
jgi:cytochrome c oxidase subunit 4